MNTRLYLLACATLTLAGCDLDLVSTSEPDDGFLREVPEGVITVAAANQDLSAVKVDPTDGCYVYRHVGPVETTLLPLRTVDGRPICTGQVAAPVEET